ncbi:MAG: class I SAM-dependent methyltransferase, partial [Actinomycetota bacterium]|nr:class I SAM-dependent methyltransferase [Actinomycetota bacterium]
TTRRHSAGGGYGIAVDSLPAQSYVESAQRMMSWDPMRHAEETGGAKGAMRKAALQAMRPYTAHQDELNRVFTQALREVDERVDDVLLETRRLSVNLRKLMGAVADGELGLVLEGLRARPASTHPAISQPDERGRPVLRFDGASADGATYRGFEDIFRGDERAVREQQQAYVDAFAGADWVLDLGCGRGEFLDALIARGIGAKGADMDDSMVARCREKGLDVELADAASYLRGLDDDSVPAIFAAQVVEHLSASQLTELLSLIERKLVPGGLAILETVNGHNPAALKAFWTDTTHHHPLYPEVLLALCRLAGFESGEVRFPQETGDFNADVYANRDYAVYARTAT